MANINEKQLRQIIRQEVQQGINSFIFQKDIQIFDGRNIVLSGKVGTKIGTKDTQKIGFFGKTPVVKLTAVSDPAGGATVDTPARTAIIAVIDALQLIGLMR